MTFDNLAIDFCPKANPVSFLLHQHWSCPEKWVNRLVRKHHDHNCKKINLSVGRDRITLELSSFKELFNRCLLGRAHFPRLANIPPPRRELHETIYWQSKVQIRLEFGIVNQMELWTLGSTSSRLRDVLRTTLDGWGHYTEKASCTSGNANYTRLDHYFTPILAPIDVMRRIFG